MIVATHTLRTDKTWIHAKAPGLGRRRWQINLYAARDQDRATQELKPEDPCYLVEVLPLATEAIDELLAEFDHTVTDAGFQVVLLR